MTHSSEAYLLGPKTEVDIGQAEFMQRILAPAEMLVARIVQHDLGTDDIVFTQTRDGLVIPKYKTIPDPEPGELYQSYGVWDPRTTALLNMIRLSGLDELPQLDLGVKGEISVVGGDRPLTEQDIEYYRESDPQFFKLHYAPRRQDYKRSLFGPASMFGHSQLHKTPDVLAREMRLSVKYWTLQASEAFDRRYLRMAVFRMGHATFRLLGKKTSEMIRGVNAHTELGQP